MNEELIVSGRMNPYIDPHLNICIGKFQVIYSLEVWQQVYCFFLLCFFILKKRKRFSGSHKMGTN